MKESQIAIGTKVRCGVTPLSPVKRVGVVVGIDEEQPTLYTVKFDDSISSYFAIELQPEPNTMEVSIGKDKVMSITFDGYEGQIEIDTTNQHPIIYVRVTDTSIEEKFMLTEAKAQGEQ